MALSRLAQEFATEIRQHDWSDAPYRMDRAGHRRSDDKRPTEDQLKDDETASVRTNVMWVVAQVLGHADPNFDACEFAEACGVTGLTPGIIKAGLRKAGDLYLQPGARAGGSWAQDTSDGGTPSIQAQSWLEITQEGKMTG